MRRAALFEEIHALSAQAWMTGTDLSLFDGAACEIFEVRDGVLLPEPPIRFDHGDLNVRTQYERL